MPRKRWRSVSGGQREKEGQSNQRRRALLLMVHLAAFATTSVAQVRGEPRASPPHGLVPTLVRVVPVLQRFLVNLPHHFELPAVNDRLGARLLAGYGAVVVAGDGVMVPPRTIFSSEEEVADFQSGLRVSEGKYQLQAAAAEALAEARADAQRHGLRISPADEAAAGRSYADTVTLWRNRIEPALRYWILRGRLDTWAARDIRSLTAREQTLAILRLEQEGMFFGAGFAKSILSSVAPPGTSQHLALLAFDVKEHRNPTVRIGDKPPGRLRPKTPKTRFT